MSLDRDDVIEAYVRLLGRLPENEQVIEMHLAGHPSRDALLVAIRASCEFVDNHNDAPTGILSDDLDTFVKICDGNGGPDSKKSKEYFDKIDFNLLSSDLLNLNPFSQEYFEYQISLYEKLSSRKLDQQIFEQTEIIDLDFHVNGHNPYTNIPPDLAAFHLLRIAKLFRYAKVPFNGRVLDMGAGWGMTSEIAAYLGCRVVALDINPQFVDLISRRAAKSQQSIVAIQSTFDSFEGPDNEKFDMIMFYECLHHALKPWSLLENLNKNVKKNGCIAIAGEPINDYWWTHWGLRIDPLSVYCIRKFGWFESGWTLSFICECFQRAGLTPIVVEDTDLGIGTIVIARKQ